MADQITLDRIETIHPKLKSQLRQIYADICEALSGAVQCRFSFVLRTVDEQDELYAQGRSKPGKIVTNARGGHSYHNYGLAIDIVMLLDKDGDGKYEEASWDEHLDFDKDGISDWQEVVAIFKRYGWEWGGDWKFQDTPHFQRTFGKSIAELLTAYNGKNFIEGTKYVSLA
jgi:peptidoglycan L-alanyl-D-glutamate endopeptidase CwlK